MLVDAYLENLKWQDEYDSAKKSLENFLGKEYKDENGDIHFKGGNAVKVLEEIKNNEDADDAFEQAVEQHF